MKTTLYGLGVVCVALAVQSATGGMGVPRGDELPTGCSVGAIYYKTGAAAGLYACAAADTWNAVASGEAPAGESVPAGAIVLSLAACATGYSEVASLSGKTVVGTTNANGDVTGTGGSDAVTPAGNNSGGAVDAHSGTAVANHASHTHTYTDVIAHTHTMPVGATDDTAAPFDRADAGSNTGGANATTATGSTGVATGTTAGPSATLTHSVTQPSAHAFTQPTFTGTSFDNRSAYVKVIFCSKD